MPLPDHTPAISAKGPDPANVVELEHSKAANKVAAMIRGRKGFEFGCMSITLSLSSLVAEPAHRVSGEVVMAVSKKALSWAGSPRQKLASYCLKSPGSQGRCAELDQVPRQRLVPQRFVWALRAERDGRKQARIDPESRTSLIRSDRRVAQSCREHPPSANSSARSKLSASVRQFQYSFGRGFTAALLRV